jgi:hypothetical protein
MRLRPDWPPLSTGAMEQEAKSSRFYGLRWDLLMNMEPTLAMALVAPIGWALPGMFKTKTSQHRGVVVGIGLATVAFFAYAFMFMAFVRSVETPENGTQYRSIGITRNAEIVRKFPNMSDEELLENVGLAETDVRRIWSSESVMLARFGLFISYFCVLAFFNLAIALHIQLTSDPANPITSPAAPRSHPQSEP